MNASRADVPTRIRRLSRGSVAGKRLLFSWTLAVIALLWATAALAVPGNEVALVLDNSGSMATPFRGPSGGVYPGNDKDRTAVLGALILAGLTHGTEDRLTVLTFGKTAAAPPIVVDASSYPTAAAAGSAIRAMPYADGTYFRPVLRQARTILDTSQRDGRLLMFLTDGAPSDIEDPSEGPRLLDIGSGRFNTIILGLYGSADARKNGEVFLRPLARMPDDLVFLNSPREVVPAFTRGYARMLGARPMTGTLAPGGKKSVDIGKYVLEMLIVTASSEPGPSFTVSLTGPKGLIPVKAQGDNGCDFQLADAPKICDPPRRHYRVFRHRTDPDNPAHFELAVTQIPGNVEYGIILRYELEAKLMLAPVVRAEEPAEIAAQLLFRGKPFVDEAFFRADGFEATAMVEGQKVRLEHAGGGRFVGKWVPPGGLAGTGTLVRATFKNTWLERSADGSLRVEGVPKLALRVNPNPLQLGGWAAGCRQTRQCGILDLAGSLNADRVEVACGTPESDSNVGVTCEPVAGSEATLPSGARGRPMRWQVCVVAKGGCGDVSSAPPSGISVTLAGTDPRHAPGAVKVPLVFQVQGISWLRCWWWVLAAIGLLLFAAWVILGFVRPHSFDPASSVRVAGSEAGLRRTSALVLRELPGGVRGFYRNARVALNANGDFVKSPRLAVLVVEAAAGGMTIFKKASGLEHKNRRTGGWEAVSPEELAQGFAPGAIYRLGSLVLKFE